MRINLRKTKPMKRDLVYTTDDWRLRPFDPTRVFAPSPHQNRQFAPPVEKVGLRLHRPLSADLDGGTRSAGRFLPARRRGGRLRRRRGPGLRADPPSFGTTLPYSSMPSI